MHLQVKKRFLPVFFNKNILDLFYIILYYMILYFISFLILLTLLIGGFIAYFVMKKVKYSLHIKKWWLIKLLLFSLLFVAIGWLYQSGYLLCWWMCAASWLHFPKRTKATLNLLSMPIFISLDTIKKQEKNSHFIRMLYTSFLQNL